MKTLSSDTSQMAEQVQIALFREASAARRFALARSLSATMIELARCAIQRRFPEASDEEVNLIFVAHHYGQDLADRLRADLARRRRP